MGILNPSHRHNHATPI